MVELPDNEYEERVVRARLAREEARQTINEQTNTLSDIDEKAIQIFRINLVVASILATGFSIVINAGTAYETLITPYTVTAGVLLFTSIILAATTYTSTAERIGIAKDTIETAILDQKYDYDLVEEEIAIEYGRMIQYNYEKNASNALLFTLTLVATVGAISYLAVGLVDIYDSSVIGGGINLAVFAFFFIFGKLSGVYGTTVRWWNLTDPINRLQSWVLAWRDKICGKDS